MSQRLRTAPAAFCQRLGRHDRSRADRVSVPFSPPPHCRAAGASLAASHAAAMAWPPGASAAESGQLDPPPPTHTHLLIPSTPGLRTRGLCLVTARRTLPKTQGQTGPPAPSSWSGGCGALCCGVKPPGRPRGRLGESKLCLALAAALAISPILASRFSLLLASRFFSLLASRFSLRASRFSLLASRFSLLASRADFPGSRRLLRVSGTLGGSQPRLAGANQSHGRPRAGSRSDGAFADGLVGRECGPAGGQM